MSGLSICGAGGFQPCGRSAMTNTHTPSCYNAKTHIRIYLGRRALILHGGSRKYTFVYTYMCFHTEYRAQSIWEGTLSLLWRSPVELKLKLLVIRTLWSLCSDKKYGWRVCCWMDLLPWAATRSTCALFSRSRIRNQHPMQSLINMVQWLNFHTQFLAF